MAQRFENIISTQSVGSGDIDKLVNSFNLLSTSIDNVNKKSEQIKPPKWESFAASAKQFIQDPLNAAGAAAEKFLLQLGPLGAGAVVAGAALGVLGKVGLDAERSLGALGDRIGDISVRTGLTVKEVQEFSLAMKMAGGDISGVEGMMRKLSQGLADGSEEGKKSAEGMRELGIATRGFHGEALPMSQVIIQLSDKLAGMTDTAQRNALAIKIMGRSALEALPDLLELSANLKSAGASSKYFATEEDLKRYDAYLKQVSQLDAEWEALKRHMKEPLAGVVSITIKGAEWLGRMFGPAGPANVPSPGGIDLTDPRWQVIGSHFQAGAAADAASVTAGAAKVAADRQRYGLGIEGSQYDAEKAKQNAAKLRDEYFALEGHASLPDVSKKYQEWQQAETAAARLTERVKLLAKAESERLNAPERLKELQKRSNEIFATSTADPSDPSSVRDAALRKIATEELFEFSKAGTNRSATARAFTLQRGAAQNDYARQAKNQFLEYFNRDTESVVGGISLGNIVENLRQTGTTDNSGNLAFLPRNLTFPTGYSSAEQNLRDVKQGESRELGLLDVRGKLGGASERTIIEQTAALRQSYANKEYVELLRIAAVKTDEAEKQRLRDDAEDQLSQKSFEARMERERAIFEIALRQKETFQSLAVGFVDAGRSGGGAGLSRFVLGQVNGLEDKVIGNAAGLIYPTIKKGLDGLHSGDPNSTIGKLLAGTPFGPDPLKNAGFTLNEAGIKLDAAAEKLLALSPSGGGGSAGGGGGVGGVGGYLSSAARTASGWALPPGSYSSGSDEFNTGYNGSALAGAGYGVDEFGADGSTVNVPAGAGSSGGGFTAAKGVGAAAALAAGAYGIYSGVHSGGARGALTASGSALAMVGAVLPLISKSLAAAGPIGMAAGMALGLVTTLLGDPKANRSAEIGRHLKYNQFMAPEALNVSTTTSGTYADYDRFGGVRGSDLYPFPNVEQGYFDYRHNTTVPGRTLSQFGGTVIVQVQAMDAKSIVDRHQDIGDAVVRAMANHTALQERIRNL